LLREMNCDFGQGYHFSKPMPVKEAENYFYSYCETNKCQI